MRLPPTHLLAISMLLAGACSRPVLYYPAPSPAQPVLAGEPAAKDTRDVSAGASGTADMMYLRDRHIVIPVAGATMEGVVDSFNEARDGGERLHHAIDILAARGTPVLSADDGRVLRLSNNKLGGISLYAEDTAGRLVYYYAHMDHYADHMSAGRPLTKGDTIGFVGTTGNAPANMPHLHFQVMRMPADRKAYWNGEPIDPFEALGGAEQGRHAAGLPH
ncbi:MAG TPA: M23 family metallopeptidase [Gemmatimonadaceae bacterium]